MQFFGFRPLYFKAGHFITRFYYMASVCSRYNARSDWLSAASRQGIILP